VKFIHFNSVEFIYFLPGGIFLYHLLSDMENNIKNLSNKAQKNCSTRYECAYLLQKNRVYDTHALNVQENQTNKAIEM
jgi:hypothetical protein